MQLCFFLSFQFGKKDKIPRRWFCILWLAGKTKNLKPISQGFQLKTEQQSPKSVCLCDTPTQNPFVITASSVRLEKRKKKKSWGFRWLGVNVRRLV
jgi:hypothetical protein